jgi:hypothetical protein
VTLSTASTLSLSEVIYMLLSIWDVCGRQHALMTVYLSCCRNTDKHRAVMRKLVIVHECNAG